jgi:alkaline phosphatase D
LYRRLSYGDLVQFDMLDVRQYRSPKITPATIPDSQARRDPARSILGVEQERWFTEGLRKSRARWNIAPQGVLMALVNTRSSADPDLPPTYSSGNWDGYQASQKRIFDSVAAARQAGSVSNFVVLTGDVHCGYVSELPSDLDEPTSAPIGTEFTSLSITSAQDFNPAANQARQIRTVVNPQMKWADLHCGYVIGELSRDSLHFDYRAVDRVSRSDDPFYSLQHFVVENGEPRVHKA